jgi:hypothetical protein
MRAHHQHIVTLSTSEDFGCWHRVCTGATPHPTWGTQRSCSRPTQPRSDHTASRCVAAHPIPHLSWSKQHCCIVSFGVCFQTCANIGNAMSLFGALPNQHNLHCFIFFCAYGYLFTRLSGLFKTMSHMQRSDSAQLFGTPILLSQQHWRGIGRRHLLQPTLMG